MLKLIEVLMKHLCCRHLLSAQNLLQDFPFLSNTYQKSGNIRTGTEIVNLYIGFVGS